MVLSYRYSHDTSFLQIASGSAPVCGFGYAPRFRAYGSGIGHRFCLRRLALARVHGSALGVWFESYVRESIANAGMRESFGIVQLSGKPGGGSGGTVRSAGKSWKLGGGKVLVFLLVSRECSRGKEIPTWSSVVPHGWI